MKAERFKKLLDELDDNSLQTMKEKNGRYAQNGDCLHNFRKGAAMMGRTPAQTCWGYMSKHLVALMDMVERNNFSDREDFLEKCQDTINYIRFLWCIGNDNVSMHMPEPGIDLPGYLQDKCVVDSGTYINSRTNFDVQTVLLSNQNRLSEDGECKYAEYTNPWVYRVCSGTKEKDPCPGYSKCDSYRPINKEKEND